MTEEIVEQISSKKLILLYGASSSGNRAKNNLLYMNVDPNRIVYFDSNKSKQGTTFYGSKVISEEDFNDLPRDILIFITSTIFYEIEKFLYEKRFTNFYYIHELIFSNKNYEKFDFEFSNYLENNKSRSNIDCDELYTIYSSLRLVKDYSGSIAEVGVYKGGSAYLLGKFSNGKKLFLFDTFQGLPDFADANLNDLKNKEPQKGWLNDSSIKEVESYVYSSGIEPKNLIIKEGIFPETASDLFDEEYSLVHLDSDLYNTTKDGLEYFYPRLQRGGRIIVHDYNCCGCPGVKKAVDEFLG
jgi:hypothetical protein